MYKKKSLKFTYERASRDVRISNTLKARENSRFERFSISRNINDSNSTIIIEATKQNTKVPEVNPAEARRNMLQKWKQEKKIKKEMESQQKKKPFYVGGNTNVFNKQSSQDFKSSFIAQPNPSFNSSSFVKSKFATSAAVVQPPKIQISKQRAANSVQSLRAPNSKQDAPKFQSSRIPNSKQKTPTPIVQSSKVQNSKQGVSTQISKVPNAKQGALTFQSSKIPNSKQTTALPKFGTTNLGKVQIPTSTVKVNLPKSGSSTAVKKFPTPASTIDKAGKGLPKPSPKVTAAAKGIPVQSKMPVPSMNTKFEWKPKLNQKETSQSSLRKGYCFKNFANSSHQRTAVLQKTPLQMTPTKLKGKITKDIKEKSHVKELEQTLDNIPDITFNSDISIIKPVESFAPANFAFHPPDELGQFEFIDDDDVYKSLEELELKFMSRTSTPTKNSERKSNSKKSVECHKSIADEKMSDASNSNNIHITELMSSDSIKVESDNKNMYEVGSKQINNEKNCDSSTNMFKEADVAAIQQVNEKMFFDSPTKTEIKNTDIAINHSVSLELISISPTKTEIKSVDCSKNNQASVELVSDSIAVNETEAYIDTNQLTCKESDSSLPTKTFVKGENITETEAHSNTNQPGSENLVSISPSKIHVKDANKTINSQSCEEITFDSGKNKKRDSSVKHEEIANEKNCNYFLKNIVSKDTPEKSVFYNMDEEDDFLDSIDLNEMDFVELDDDDSGEDDVILPQISKFSERKSTGAVPKRVSMLKNLPVMNSISEAVEASDCVPSNSTKSSKDNLKTKTTPRRSKRISGGLVDTFNDMSLDNCNSPITPRRSSRLMKKATTDNHNTVSPLQDTKNTNIAKLRQSIKLIDLGTPEKAVSKKLFKDNSENLDPNTLLIDLESPTKPSLLKSKKVSLLYSPEKRKSIRKSIRGDLMAFSPV